MIDLLSISFTQEIICSMIFFTIFGCAIIAEVANNKRIDQISSLLLLMFIIYPSFFQPIIIEIINLYHTKYLFSHSWLPFIYQYGIGIFIFSGGLFAIFKSYGPKQLWSKYKALVVALVWGFIYVTSIHLLMTIAALNDTPMLYLAILSLYIITGIFLSRFVR